MQSRNVTSWVVVLIGVSTFVGVGCATPAPIVRLAPVASNVIWVAGRAAVEQERAGVRVATAFEHQDGGNHAVHVEIENRGDQPIVVGPEDIWFAPCAGTTEKSCAPARFIIDPEQALADLDVRESTGRAQAANQQAFGTTVLILSAAGDVAQVASGHADRSTGAGTASIAASIEADQVRHETAALSIASQREVWANAAFRRSTLLPGRGVAGNIFFPADLGQEFVVLCVRVRGETLAFWFRQTVIPVAAPPVHSPVNRG
jgi:hypothetical protein